MAGMLVVAGGRAARAEARRLAVRAQAGGQERDWVRAPARVRGGSLASTASIPAAPSLSGVCAKRARWRAVSAAALALSVTFIVRRCRPQSPEALAAASQSSASRGVVRLSRLGPPGWLSTQFTGALSPPMYTAVALGAKAGVLEKGWEAAPTSTRCVELLRVRLSQASGGGGRVRAPRAALAAAAAAYTVSRSRQEEFVAVELS